jgi:hypothetical protein
VAQQQPAELSQFLVRPGEAKGTRPQALAGIPKSEPPAPSVEQEPAKSPSTPPTGEGAGEGAVTTIVPRRPAPPKRSELVTLSIRVPLDLSEGLRQMAHETREEKQLLVARMIEAGLVAWDPNWRTFIPS